MLNALLLHQSELSTKKQPTVSCSATFEENCSRQNKETQLKAHRQTRDALYPQLMPHLYEYPTRILTYEQAFT